VLREEASTIHDKSCIRAEEVWSSVRANCSLAPITRMNRWKSPLPPMASPAKERKISQGKFRVFIFAPSTGTSNEGRGNRQEKGSFVID
jgi:hypothetical protein